MARRSPRRHDRDFGPMTCKAGCIPCRIARTVGGRQPGIHPHCHLSQPPKGWRPSPLGSALSCLPRVASGLTGKPAPPDTLSAWTETTPRPPAIPPRTVRLDSARVRGDEVRIGEGFGAGISYGAGRRSCWPRCPPEVSNSAPGASALELPAGAGRVSPEPAAPDDRRQGAWDADD